MYLNNSFTKKWIIKIKIKISSKIFQTRHDFLGISYF